MLGYMLKPTLLLRIAAVLTLLTAAGHTFGTFAPVPPEQTAVQNAVNVMQSTLVPMPVGKSQTFGDIFFGNNILVSVFLLVAGLILLMTAKTPAQGRHRGIITVVALGLAAVAIISGRYFFPLPAIFTGLAAIFSLVSAKVAE